MQELKAILLVLMVMFVVAILFACAENAVPRTDSQGVPCTISDARNADGSLECR